MKNVFLLTAFLLSLLLFPLKGTAQEVKIDVHAGANLSGFVSGNGFVVQDKKTMAGANVGAGVSYETKNKIVFSSGLDFLQTSGKYSVLSNYLSDGQLKYSYPEVKSREVAVEVPAKIGYDFSLGKKFQLIPSVGAYVRYSIASIKQNVTENFAGNQLNTFKWDCFENHQSKNQHLDAYKRWDVGALVEAKLLYAQHYSLSLGYSRGFMNKSFQYKIKNQSFKVTLGYVF